MGMSPYDNHRRAVLRITVMCRQLDFVFRLARHTGSASAVLATLVADSEILFMIRRRMTGSLPGGRPTEGEALDSTDPDRVVRLAVAEALARVADEDSLGLGEGDALERLGRGLREVLRRALDDRVPLTTPEFVDLCRDLRPAP